MNDATLSTIAPKDIASMIVRATAAQRVWASTPVKHRAAMLGRLRELIVERADELATCVTHDQRRSDDETLSSEVTPLADAAAFAQKRAAKLLRPRKIRQGRPLWAMGQRVVEQRVPWGIVLIIAPGNYPLMLPGVQTIQALVAGNAVLLKPGGQGAPAAAALASLFADAGLPDGLLQVTDESPDTAQAAIKAGVDHIVLTGSTATGKAVLQQAAEQVTPCTLELGGCDAAVVCEDADLDLVIQSLTFALLANSGATCIAPRRLFVHRSLVEATEQRLVEAAATLPDAALSHANMQRLGAMIDDAIVKGARLIHSHRPADQTISPIIVSDATDDMRLMQEDSFCPIISISSFADDDQVAGRVNATPFGLGATLFGSPARTTALAARLKVGQVVINDMIVPTADPRVSFGGASQSGYGSTRGELGLMNMTRPRTLVRRGGTFRPHLDPPDANTSNLLRGYLRLAHGRGIGKRLSGLTQMIRAMKRSTKKGSHP